LSRGRLKCARRNQDKLKFSNGVQACACAGISHSTALDDNGYVWCWGYNNSGQLGNDSTTTSYDPVQVRKGEMTGASTYLEGIVDVAVSCGYSLGDGGYGSSYAVDVNGHVWAWGSNYGMDPNYPYETEVCGQLGNNSETDSYTPVQVHDGEMCTDSGKLEDIIAVSAGDAHVLALDKYGRVWAWGYGQYGQLGNGSTGNKEAPVRVKTISKEGLQDIVFIDAGFNHSLAIDKYGQIWVWGRNYDGQLGLGHKDYRLYAEEMLLD